MAASKGAPKLQQQTFDAEQKRYALGASTVIPRHPDATRPHQLRKARNCAPPSPTLPKPRPNYEPRRRGAPSKPIALPSPMARLERRARETLIPGTLHGPSGRDRKSFSYNGRPKSSFQQRYNPGGPGAFRPGRFFFLCPECRLVRFFSSRPSPATPCPFRTFRIALNPQALCIVAWVPVLGSDAPLSEQRKGSTQNGAAVRGRLPRIANLLPKNKPGKKKHASNPRWKKKAPNDKAEFTTISGHPISPTVYQSGFTEWGTRTRDLGFPGEPPLYARHSFHDASQPPFGNPCGNSRASERPKTTNQRFRYLPSAPGADRAFPPPSTCPR